MTNKVTFIARVKSEGIEQFDKIRQRVQDLTTQYKDMGSGISSVADRVGDFAEKNKAAFQDMRNYGGAAFAWLTAGVLKFTDTAGKFDMLGWAYDRLTEKFWINGDEMLKGLQEASKWTISNNDLILASNKAMNLGVAKNMDEMITLLEIARVKGQSMGLSTTQAFDDIVTGLGRGSVMILDNLGITVKQAEAQERYAQMLGKTTDQLTEQEKKQALLNVVVADGKKELEETGDLALQQGEKYQVARASVANLSVTIGQSLYPVMESFLKIVTPIIEKISNRVQNNEELFAKMVKGAIVVSGLVAVIGTVGTVLPKVVAVVKFGVTAFKALRIAIAALSWPVGRLVIAATAIFTAYKTNFLGFRDLVDKVFAKVKQIFSGFVDFIGKQVKFWKQIFTGDFSGARETVKSLFGEGAQAIMTIFEWLIQNALQRGANAIQNLIDGIKSKISAVGDAVREVAGKIGDFLGFSSPTKEWPGAQADQWMPNMMKMLAAGIIATTPMVAWAASDVATAIEWHIQTIADSEVLGEAAQAFEDFGKEATGHLQDFESEFAEQAANIREQAIDLAKSFEDLQKSFNMETQTENMSMAEEIVGQKDKIRSIEEDIMKEKQNLREADGIKQQQAIQRQLDNLQTSLQREKDALRSAQQYEIALKNEVQEVERRNRLTSFERFVEDRELKQTARVKEFEEKKQQMRDEAIHLLAQQKVMLATREAATALINELVTRAQNHYNSAVENQTLVTKSETDKMVRYFNGVSNAIATMISRAKEARSMGLSTGGFARFATGGLVDRQNIQGGVVVGPKWTDRVPAMLTAGELVLNSAQQQNLAGQLTSKQGISVILQGNNFYGDDPEMAQKIGDQIVDIIKTNYNFNWQ